MSSASATKVTHKLASLTTERPTIEIFKNMNVTSMVILEVNNKEEDQTALLRGLICTFVVRRWRKPVYS